MKVWHHLICGRLVLTSIHRKWRKKGLFSSLGSRRALKLMSGSGSKKIFVMPSEQQQATSHTQHYWPTSLHLLGSTPLVMRSYSRSLHWTRGQSSGLWRWSFDRKPSGLVHRPHELPDLPGHHSHVLPWPIWCRPISERRWRPKGWRIGCWKRPLMIKALVRPWVQNVIRSASALV